MTVSAEGLGLHGGCQCGAVRYTVHGTLGAPEHCHCSRCRKAHGAAFSTNAAVPADALQITTGADCLGEYAPS